MEKVSNGMLFKSAGTSEFGLTTHYWLIKLSLVHDVLVQFGSQQSHLKLIFVIFVIGVRVAPQTQI